LTADLRRLHITVDAQFLKMLDTARDGLSHRIPGASMEQVLTTALELLLEKQARARGLAKRPRKVLATPAPTATATPSTTPSATPDFTDPRHRRTGPRQHVAASVRRAVWERDSGRCSWPLDGGGTCGSTHRLELDHIVPWARWGGETIDDLRIVCRAHNALAARQAFGDRCLARYGRAVPSSR
jgi:5-methylcytosine-specific restriction endonuclease McrA